MNLRNALLDPGRHEKRFPPSAARVIGRHLADVLPGLVPRNKPQTNRDAGREEQLGGHGDDAVGEVGLTGSAAAVTDAVYHATGKRVRKLPVTIENLLA